MYTTSILRGGGKKKCRNEPNPYPSRQKNKSDNRKRQERKIDRGGEGEKMRKEARD